MVIVVGDSVLSLGAIGLEGSAVRADPASPLVDFVLV